jgi:hypothetical protein
MSHISRLVERYMERASFHSGSWTGRKLQESALDWT